VVATVTPLIDAFRAAKDQFPTENDDFAPELMVLPNGIAELLRSIHEYRSAIPFVVEHVRCAEKFWAQIPMSDTNQWRLGCKNCLEAKIELAETLAAAGDVAEALLAFDECCSFLRDHKATLRPPTLSDMALEDLVALAMSVERNKGLLLTEAGKFAEAEAAFQNARAVLKQEEEAQGTLACLDEEMRVHLGVGELHWLSGRRDQAKTAFEAARQLVAPLSPQLRRSVRGMVLAYLQLLATCPDPTVRDFERALKEAQPFLNAKDAFSLLGAIYHAAGRHNEALTVLTKRVELVDGGTAEDYFYLAMTHGHLGDKKAAAKWYDDAVKWADARNPNTVVLRRLRSDAAALLGK
jgi:tetratricopeptide (TPR) repeat protein